MGTQKGSEPANFAFIHFTEFTEALDEIDRALGCTSVRWTTDEGVHDNLKTWANSKSAKRLRVREWFGMKQFDSIEGGVNVSVPTLELNCLQKFCIGLSKGSIATGLRNPDPTLKACKAT